jgi:hypothetical protein
MLRENQVQDVSDSILLAMCRYRMKTIRASQDDVMNLVQPCLGTDQPPCGFKGAFM